MPTASTAQILGNNESIEPYTSNIYSRRVLSGEFQVKNLFYFLRVFIKISFLKINEKLKKKNNNLFMPLIHSVMLI